MTTEQIKAAANIIKETVSAKDYAVMIGMSVNRAGFTTCPFHSGDHDASLKLYDGRRGWHCFGCHASGDVIELAKRNFGLNYPQAIEKVAADCGITIPGSAKKDYKTSVSLHKAKEAEKARKAEQATRQKVEDAYWKAFDAWRSLDCLVQDMDAEELKHPEEPFSDEFAKLLERRQQAYENLNYLTIWRDSL